MKCLLYKKIAINEKIFYVLASIIVLLLVDIALPPEKQTSAKILLFSIKQYRAFISPHLKGVVKCKFEPTCSEYGYTSIKWYGSFWGTLKTINRLFRCSPWSTSSGWDPP